MPKEVQLDIRENNSQQGYRGIGIGWGGSPSQEVLRTVEMWDTESENDGAAWGSTWGPQRASPTVL